MTKNLYNSSQPHLSLGVHMFVLYICLYFLAYIYDQCSFLALLD